jgi:hypothetical protein
LITTDFCRYVSTAFLANLTSSVPSLSEINKAIHAKQIKKSCPYSYFVSVLGHAGTSIRRIYCGTEILVPTKEANWMLIKTY